MQTGDQRIDVEQIADDSEWVQIYCKQRTFICGVGMPLIIIPLIPLDTPKYKRALVGTGKYTTRSNALAVEHSIER